jgi:hypothetical protein
MSELNRNLGASGAPHEIEANGKIYQLLPIDQKVKVTYGKKAFLKARSRINELKDEISPDEFNSRMNQVSADYENGEFEFEGKRGLASLRTIKGCSLLISILANVNEDEARSILLQKPNEIQPLINLVIQEAFPDAVISKEESKDPK